MDEKHYFEIHKYALKIFKNNMHDIIEKYKNSNRKFIMFGTSIISEMIVNELKETPLDISFIIDNSESRQGMIVYGKEVYSPKEVKDNFNKQYIILIASSFQEEMITQLETFGYKFEENIIKVIDLPKLMTDYSYLDRSKYIKLNREEVRNIQLGILDKIDQVSKKENLNYYLSSGTLLGAVRHGGYIPWDDDVDVFLPVNDYLKLIKVLEKDERYKIISQFNTDYYFGWGAGYMVDTTTICDMNKFPIQLTTGQSIDLFPLYGIPHQKEEKDFYLKKIKELENQCLVALEDNDRIESIKELNNFLMKYTYEECELVGNPLMPYFVRDIFEKEFFGEGVEVQFEHLQLKAPAKYDAYLKQMYGDYMKLPPEDKRVGEHFYNTYYIK